MNSQALNRQTSVVRQLVWKDLQLHSRVILFSILFGTAGLSLLLMKREAVSVIGAIMLFMALIIIGCLLAVSNILNDRKKQTLPFLMSLPISSMEYTTSKLVSTVGIFLISWIPLMLAAVWLIAVQGVLPHGAIPVALILLLLPFVEVCGILGMTLVGETEGWNMTANVIFNSVPGLTWYFISTSPTLMHNVAGGAPVWDRPVLTFLSCELALIVTILAVTYYLQSRKRDFI